MTLYQRVSDTMGISYMFVYPKDNFHAVYLNVLFCGEEVKSIMEL